MALQPAEAACGSPRHRWAEGAAPASLRLPAAEIVMLDNYVMVYKYLGDLMFCVTGSQDENELILFTVLQAFYESVSILLRCVAQHESSDAHSAPTSISSTQERACGVCGSAGEPAWTEASRVR